MKTLGYGIIAFRDRNGIRPLIYGTRKTSKGNDYMIASESVAMEQLGFRDFEDVKPGTYFCFVHSHRHWVKDTNLSNHKRRSHHLQ